MTIDHVGLFIIVYYDAPIWASFRRERRGAFNKFVVSSGKKYHELYRFYTITKSQKMSQQNSRVETTIFQKENSLGPIAHSRVAMFAKFLQLFWSFEMKN